MVYNGILFNNIKEQIVNFYIDNGKTWMSLKNIVLNERSQTQKTTYFIFGNSIYIKFLEKTKKRDTKQMSGFLGLEVEVRIVCKCVRGHFLR